jgi:hypothetical protein
MDASLAKPHGSAEIMVLTALHAGGFCCSVRRARSSSGYKDDPKPLEKSIDMLGKMLVSLPTYRRNYLSHQREEHTALFCEITLADAALCPFFFSSARNLCSL